MAHAGEAILRVGAALDLGFDDAEGARVEEVVGVAEAAGLVGPELHAVGRGFDVEDAVGGLGDDVVRGAGAAVAVTMATASSR